MALLYDVNQILRGFGDAEHFMKLAGRYRVIFYE